MALANTAEKVKKW